MVESTRTATKWSSWVDYFVVVVVVVTNVDLKWNPTLSDAAACFL